MSDSKHLILRLLLGFWTVIVVMLFVSFYVANAQAADKPFCEKHDTIQDFKGPATMETMPSTEYFKQNWHHESCDIVKTDHGSFITYLTFDDDCDGGNTFGYVTDRKGAVIATVLDSEVWCDTEL